MINNQQTNFFLQKDDISFKAKGLFLTLFAKYGTEFEISREEILHLSKKDKLISTYSAIKELEEAGLLFRTHTRTNGGRYGKYIIKINLTLTN